jgi:hypothetical protein
MKVFILLLLATCSSMTAQQATAKKLISDFYEAFDTNNTLKQRRVLNQLYKNDPATLSPEERVTVTDMIDKLTQKKSVLVGEIPDRWKKALAGIKPAPTKPAAPAPAAKVPPPVPPLPVGQKPAPAKTPPPLPPPSAAMQKQTELEQAEAQWIAQRTKKHNITESDAYLRYGLRTKWGSMSKKAQGKILDAFQALSTNHQSNYIAELVKDKNIDPEVTRTALRERVPMGAAQKARIDQAAAAAGVQIPKDEEEKQDKERKEKEVKGLDFDDEPPVAAAAGDITVETSDKKRIKLAKAIALNQEVSTLLETSVTNDPASRVYPIRISSSNFAILQPLLTRANTILTQQKMKVAKREKEFEHAPLTLPIAELETAQHRKEVVDALRKELLDKKVDPTKLPDLIKDADWLDSPYVLEALISLYVSELHKDVASIPKKVAAQGFSKPLVQLIALRYLLQFNEDIAQQLGVQVSIPFLPYYTVATLFAYKKIPDSELEEFPNIFTNINEVKKGRTERSFSHTLLSGLAAATPEAPDRQQRHDAIPLLLKVKGIDINLYAPLGWAIHGYANLVAQLLINAKADLNQPDIAGEVPMDTAINMRNRQAIEMLLKAGVKPTPKNLFEVNLYPLAGLTGKFIQTGASLTEAIEYTRKMDRDDIVDYLSNFLGLSIPEISHKEQEILTPAEQRYLISYGSGVSSVLDCAYGAGGWDNLSSKLRKMVIDGFMSQPKEAADYFSFLWNDARKYGLPALVRWPSLVAMRDAIQKAIAAHAPDAAKQLGALTPP